MRQFNFFLIFAFCLAIALFSIENTHSATIQVVPGYEVQAPISVEIFLSMGVGATLAWLFGMWSQLQKQLAVLTSRKEIRLKEEQIEQKDKKIENLEENLQKFQFELYQQRQLMPASKPKSE